MRRGRQPNDEDPRGRVAEAGKRTTPVGLGTEAGDLLAGHLLAPRDEPRAASAGDDLGRQGGQFGLAPHYLRRRRWKRRAAIDSPRTPRPNRYTTSTTSVGSRIPVVRPRRRCVPRYSGDSWTTAWMAGG